MAEAHRGQEIATEVFLPSALQTSAMFWNHADALRIFKSARFVS